MRPRIGRIAGSDNSQRL